MSIHNGHFEYFIHRNRYFFQILLMSRDSFILYHGIILSKKEQWTNTGPLIYVCLCLCRQQQGEEDVCGREEAAIQWS